ncbi:hypothetical protein BAUCODRAFT_403416 [Baudoinia panamericana UAMH 10762]|uniref:YTH domain-containing protein n=1 Tax=Baudoinia panamericana (strain UAMH 10762) TaxID=717646 RepID=M2MM59_BAUPA|nr:uncharacterized protein BAUCODRAFT_403416 [Baudoinia panamericana UAMH 10762]EMC97771.1 hypothetical protein BAUCODRAFT_403416 [Baudoinia panamericana UAMH 10762]
MADDNSSEVSDAISDHYLERNPELAGMTPVIFRQDPHSRSFKRLAMAAGGHMEEAFAGAYDIINSINPEVFQMPFGTRVVNIKTDFSDNIIFGAKKGQWATLEKVSERIMKLYEARKHSSEQVLFLFAVNGSKQFCGLARMSGPWDRNGRIDGWLEKESSAPSLG